MRAALHPALPPRVSWPWIGAASLLWIVAAAINLLTAPESLPPGPMGGKASLVTDLFESRYGSRAVASTEVGDVLLEFDDPGSLLRGSEIEFHGEVRGEPGRLGARRYRGRVSVRRWELVGERPAVYVAIGQSVRDEVMESLKPLTPGRGLLAGFLIGDISGLSRADEEAMRRTGLSHFVAVSGSNVALFIGLLVVAAGPLGMGPRRRALLGLAGLPIYAAATRFEPSVLRASVMAALALGGRLVGLVFEAWQLLSLAVGILIVAQPNLTASAGFQLSVVATAGVLVGARWPVPGAKAGRALAVTIGAQAAVAPLLIAHFGSIPMMSPLANLLAAPLVTASTLVGAVGVVGPDSLLAIAEWLADVVLFLARGSEGWPQLGPVQVLALGVAALIVARWPRTLPLAAVAGLGIVVVSVLGLGRSAPDSSVIVLDVGQGDAILLSGGDGRFALVDGGPDEVELLERLRVYGVGRLDLVVMTHVHADHATGLSALPGRLEIGQVWARAGPHETGASVAFFDRVAEYGIPLVEPSVGEVYGLGALSLEVRGPLRRYASPNDQSVVIEVRGSQRSMLLVGDIEVVAQRELSGLQADVLKVPHQGAATSDPDWLREVGASLAVISVGPNQFGHPADWVIETLEDSGAQVLRTDQDGDVTVPLG